jgi:hypothetical protein
VGVSPVRGGAAVIVLVTLAAGACGGSPGAVSPSTLPGGLVPGGAVRGADGPVPGVEAPNTTCPLPTTIPAGQPDLPGAPPPPAGLIRPVRAGGGTGGSKTGGKSGGQSSGRKSGGSSSATPRADTDTDTGGGTDSGGGSDSGGDSPTARRPSSPSPGPAPTRNQPSPTRNQPASTPRRIC